MIPRTWLPPSWSLPHDTLGNAVSGMLYSLVGHGRPHRGAYRHGKCRGAYPIMERTSIVELTAIVETWLPPSWNLLERTAMDT